MKSIKHIALGTFLTLGLFFAILYTSCTKDSCKGVTCLNGGQCGGGTCTCPTAGVGVSGNNCETVYRLLYNNTYKGIATYEIIHADTNNTLAFVAGMDSNYTQMQLTWSDTGTAVVTMPITLTSSSLTGSVFTITATTAGAYSYSGTGNVNATTASVNLILTQTNGQGQPIIVTLNNFNRQ